MAKEKETLGTTIKPIKNNDVDKLIKRLGTTPEQMALFHVEKHAEIDGVEMGVLESGVPYLTGRGLERMCGVGHGPFHRLTTEWSEQQHKPRGKKISQLLQEIGYFEPELYVKAEVNGKEVLVFTEPVCMAMLEYYAFFADEVRHQAIHAYRTLARRQFREFVYDAVGYSPEQTHLDSWKHFHDRVDMTMDSVPLGYFSVFREIAQMIVPMIRAGILMSDKVIPDISVGRAWSSFWKENELENAYGDRIQYSHEYPLYYPQAKSNPQPTFAYPDECLAVFRSWLRREYITSKLPNYLINQSKKGKIRADVAAKAIQGFANPILEHKGNDTEFNKSLKQALDYNPKD